MTRTRICPDDERETLIGIVNDMRSRGMKYADIMLILGLSKGTVDRILNAPKRDRRVSDKAKVQRHVDPALIARAKEARESGMPYSMIGRLLGVTSRRAYDLANYEKRLIQHRESLRKWREKNPAHKGCMSEEDWKRRMKYERDRAARIRYIETGERSVRRVED